MVQYTKEQRQKWMASLDARFSSAAVLIENTKGELLILKANYKDNWGLPGGVVDAGESPLAAAVREAKEEANIDLAPGELTLAMVASRQSEDYLSHQFVFTAVLPDDRIANIRLQESEIEDSYFISKEEVAQANFPLLWAVKLWAKQEFGYVETKITSTVAGFQDEKIVAITPMYSLAKKEDKKMGKLVISRHGESEWNLLGKWTGLTDVGLTEKGIADTERLGELLKGMAFDEAYTSALKRTHQTLDALLKGAGIAEDMPVVRAAELNERDYGDLTGKNKWEVKDEIGEEAFNGIRRGWDYPVPGGETLKDVYARAVPYFQSEILPKLQAGENILLVAHGNSIRALIKYLDQVPESDMAHVEMPFGQLLVYTFTADSALPKNKEVRSVEIEPVNA